MVYLALKHPNLLLVLITNDHFGREAVDGVSEFVSCVWLRSPEEFCDFVKEHVQRCT